MVISKELIEYLEALGRIRLSDEAREKAMEDMQNIVSYIDVLNELDTDGVEPMSHSFPIKNVVREDEVKPSTDREVLLSNAPKQKDGCFMVPRTFE